MRVFFCTCELDFRQICTSVVHFYRRDNWPCGRGLKFWISEEKGLLYYPCSKNKGADQLCNYSTAYLCLCFPNADCWFSAAAAQIFIKGHRYGSI